jgi:hypothetical protein
MTKPTYKLSNYWKPTPKNIRKVADALMLISATAATISAVNESEGLMAFFLILGTFGKILSNFFAVEKHTEK